MKIEKCKNKNCKHPKYKHLQGELNCTVVIEAIPQYDVSIVPINAKGEDMPICAYKTCPCREFKEK